MDKAVVFDYTQHQQFLTHFTEIHMDCITQDFTVASFLPPLQNAKMLRWWESRATEVKAGVRDIIFLRSTESESGEEPKIVGVVMLFKPPSETGPFRAWVEKLLVSPLFRRRGAARKLMQKLEEVAKADGRTLLMLDTETGSPAEDVYPKLGYIRVGVIPNYEIRPGDGKLGHETFFYKDLRARK